MDPVDESIPIGQQLLDGVVENLYAAERCLELIQDPEITSTDIRGELGEPGEGLGCVEAPRGTLFHHYWAEADGIAKRVNLIMATTQNHGPICMSIKRPLKKLIRRGVVEEGYYLRSAFSRSRPREPERDVFNQAYMIDFVGMLVKKS